MSDMPELDIDTASHAGVRVRGYSAETVCRLVAETEALREDAERYRALVQTMEGAKCGASLCVNEHLSCHDEPDPGGVVSLQWYPDNSVGFTVVQADTIAEVIDQARGAQCSRRARDAD